VECVTDHAPYRDPSRSIEERVADPIGRMTRPEKVGQMQQLDAAATWTTASLPTEWSLLTAWCGPGCGPPADYADAVAWASGAGALPTGRSGIRPVKNNETSASRARMPSEASSACDCEAAFCLTSS
jgi:hypothetical protein